MEEVAPAGVLELALVEQQLLVATEDKTMDRHSRLKLEEPKEEKAKRTTLPNGQHTTLNKRRNNSSRNRQEGSRQRQQQQQVVVVNKTTARSGKNTIVNRLLCNSKEEDRADTEVDSVSVLDVSFLIRSCSSVPSACPHHIKQWLIVVAAVLVASCLRLYDC